MHFIKQGDLVIATIFLLLTSAIASCNGCNKVARNNSHPEISDSDIKKGEALAKMHCQSCHSLPDPSQLNSKTWEQGVLPAMGPRLGIFAWKNKSYPFSRYDMDLGKNYYPQKPLVQPDEWQNIINYFIATSPDTLNDQKEGQAGIKTGLPLFAVEAPAEASLNPATSLVKITEDALAGVVTSDAIKQSLYRFDSDLKVVDSLKNRGPIVDIEINKSDWLTCDIGILNPNNGKYGSGRKLSLGQNRKLKQDSTPLFQELQRPVQITSQDLNNDGKTDYLVCEFGFLTGALSWMENKGNGRFDRRVLRPLPGAVKSYINDYNGDGLPDFWVLFSQGEEGVFLYTNKGQGRFEEKKVLGFPAVYGSSFFELVDYNKDGSLDIVYTSGDNADYSTILKPYHGVYIFLNDGKNNFRQSFFFHINGCFKAIARDYDNDNDIDIAAISFFADYKNHPEEGFVYLENTGNNKFAPYTFPEAQQGRWLTMDAGDINADGKIDLILGNFSIGPAMMKSKYDWHKGPPFLVLKNTGKKDSK
ncbi:FG-GAP repeat domain-containing protein [Segetibacter aerophilus]|nr:VCBS repeat-containing protein [Segetibacter aerophilus]